MAHPGGSDPAAVAPGAGGDRRRGARPSGRRPAEVRLLLATKTQSAGPDHHRAAAGYRLIGENRVQEVVAKAEELAGVPARDPLHRPSAGQQDQPVARPHQLPADAGLG